MGLSNCIFIFSKQHICNYLLPSSIRFDYKTSLGWCFPPSRTAEGENSTSYLVNVREKWRRVKSACSHEWLLKSVCAHKGSKANSYLCLYIPHTQETEEEIHLPQPGEGRWGRLQLRSERKVKKVRRRLSVTSGTRVNSVIWCSDLNI